MIIATVQHLLVWPARKATSVEQLRKIVVPSTWVVARMATWPVNPPAQR
jgi:hypothetical protein